MKRKIILFLILFIFGCLSVLKGEEEKIVPMPDLVKAQFLSVDSQQLYATHDTTVYIYSLKDFKLLKKFGESGQGPGEFARVVMGVFPYKDELIINSMGKVSFFKRDGTYIKEMKPKGGIFSSLNIRPVNDHFAGIGLKISANQGAKMNISIYDKELNKLKEISSSVEFRQGKKFSIFQQSQLFYDVFKEHIFVIEGGRNCRL